MSYTDVIGWINLYGDVLCLEDGDSETDTPIFYGEEWDYQIYCDHCGREIEGITLIEYP